MRTETKLAIGLVFLLCASGQPAAQDLFVSTSGDDSNDCYSWASPCKTIQEAINRAPGGHANVFVAAGSYQEVLDINFQDQLAILGEPGVEVVPPGDVGNTLVWVNDSRKVEISDIALRNSGASSGVTGVRIFNSTVGFHGGVVEDFSSGGIVLHEFSHLRITNSVIRRNGTYGVRVDDGYHAILSDAVVIEDNTYQGIAMNGGTVKLSGPVFIRDNNIGIYNRGGRLSGGGELVIGDNTYGVRSRGGYIDIRGPAEISGNSQYGIRVIQGAGILGMYSGTPLTVTGNGTQGDENTAAIWVDQNGALDFANVEVTENPSIGVLATDQSAVSFLWPASITNNGADGVFLDRLSTARITEYADLTGNHGVDLRCDNGSLASGDKSVIGKMKCAGFINN